MSDKLYDNPCTVLHIASGDLWAGAEVQVHLLVTELAKLGGFRIQCVLLNEGELARRLRSSGIEVDVLDESRFNAFTIMCRLRDIMLLASPDIVHTHRSKENILGTIANLTTVRASMVRTLHGASEHVGGWTSPKRYIVDRVDAWAGKYGCRRIIAVSSALAKSLQTGGYKNVVCVSNGIDIDAVAGAQIKPRCIVMEPKPVRHIAFVGRLEPVKRPDLFLEAAEWLEKNQPWRRLRWHLFGDGSLRAALVARARQLGLTDRVKFHGHRTEVSQWIGSFDALVLCSDHEGLPMVLLEAMAAGTPVVGHAVGGVLEVLQEDIGGVLVTRHDATGYAEGLIRVLDGSAVDQGGSVCHQRLRESYSATRTAELTAEVYRECLCSR